MSLPTSGNKKEAGWQATGGFVKKLVFRLIRIITAVPGINGSSVESFTAGETALYSESSLA